MNKVWLQSYPEGVPHEITSQAAKYNSLADVISQACQKHADKYAYQCMGAAITYKELDKHAQELAAWLQHKGVNKGDRVAIMMPNLLQYPIAIYAVLRAGAILVNINPLYTSAELQQYLFDSGAKTIIIAENFAHTLSPIVNNTNIENVLVTGIGDLLGGLKGWATNFVVKYVKKMIPEWDIPNSDSFKTALKQGASLTFTPVALTHADTACLQYTGGTTGVAKGAMLSHGNLVSNLCQAYAWVKVSMKSPDQQCVVTALPLYHIFAFTANFLLFLHMGAKNVLIVNARDIPSMIKSLRHIPFTAITGVNTLFNGLLNNPDFAKLDFSKLRWTLGGGMAVQESVAIRWLKVTRRPIAQAYGLTETSPAVCINPLDQTKFNNSIGLPVPSTEVVFRDFDMQNKGLNELGEICVRGPQVTAGYWNNPRETEAAFDPDGFFRTGDIGYMDDAGYVFIMDRKKDMILVSGFNVYPNEVEAIAVKHPDIIEAAAIGVPSEHSGEEVKLFVVSRNHKLSQQDVIAHCRSQLAGYKVPKSVEFRAELPKSNVGKILRRELK